MTTKRTLAPLTAIALAAVVVLTGCTQPAPTTTESTSTSPTPTPTPTPTIAAPVTGEAPKDSDEAYSQAKKAIDAFIEVQYLIQEEGGAGVDRIEPYASGAALDLMKNIAADMRKQELTITGGAPGWEPDASGTTFGDVIISKKEKITNGIVYVPGCWDLSKQAGVRADGSAAEDRPVKVFPIQFNVTLIPGENVWKVTAQTNISKEAGAPKC